MGQTVIPEIRTLRIKAGFPTMKAASLVLNVKYRTWQDWELYDPASSYKEDKIDQLKKLIPKGK